MDDNLQQYRTLLITAEQKAQEDYDKTVLTLSGGALGVSFAFVKDIVGTDPLIHSWLLLVAWVAWGASVGCVLTSFYMSHRALKRTIEQVDANKIYDQPLGGMYSWITAILNAAGGLLFLSGVLFMIVFVSYNLR